jgi:hypothetical protein
MPRLVIRHLGLIELAISPDEIEASRLLRFRKGQEKNQLTRIEIFWTSWHPKRLILAENVSVGRRRLKEEAETAFQTVFANSGGPWLTKITI